jgi:hypothetical protein
MKNGLYKAAFQTPLGIGYGVVVLNNGEVLGGDAGMYYSGRYTIAGDKFTAQISTERHTVISGVTSVFGRDNVSVQLAGDISGDSVKMSGTSPQAPGINFQATLTLLKASP